MGVIRHICLYDEPSGFKDGQPLFHFIDGLVRSPDETVGVPGLELGHAPAFQLLNDGDSAFERICVYVVPDRVKGDHLWPADAQFAGRI